MYNFDTEDENLATGALLLYAIYRSRDYKRFKITPDMWGIIERAVKSAGMRANDLPDFMERLKPKLSCSTIKPKYAAAGSSEFMTMLENEYGEFVSLPENPDKRHFLTEIIKNADNREVLETIYKKTAFVVLLVRERLEREKPYETILEEKE